jgi:hypothetical protein
MSEDIAAAVGRVSRGSIQCPLYLGLRRLFQGYAYVQVVKIMFPRPKVQPGVSDASLSFRFRGHHGS